MNTEMVARELCAAARELTAAKQTFGDFYVEEGFTNGSDLSKILDKADSSIDIIEDGDTKFELVYNKTLKGFEISLEFLFELERNKVSATCSRWTVEDGEAGDGEEVDKKTFKLTDDIKDASAWIKSCIRKGNKRTFRSSCVSDEQVARELVAAAELLVAGSWETQLSSHFGIEAKPTSKDYKRIEDIGKKALKSVGPFKDEGGMMPPDVERKVKAKEAQLAENMARSITDAAKAYRRALAAEDINYHTVAEAFFERARVLWHDMQYDLKNTKKSSDTQIARELVAAAKLLLAAPNLKDIQRTLNELDELGDNIEDSIETFSRHFRVAGATDIDNQKDLLRKAEDGLSSVRILQNSIRSILEQFPDDKTALRTQKDADVMFARFERYQVTASKVISTLSKKNLPPALKKLATSAARIIQSKLIDSKALQVIPWQVKTHRGGVIYEVILRVIVPEDVVVGGEVQVILGEHTNSVDGAGVIQYKGSATVTPTGAKDVAGILLEQIRGWAGMKGESDAVEGRRAAAQAIARILNSALRRGWDSRDAEIGHGNLEIEGSYRSDLPKEGAYEVGEDDFNRMLSSEISSFKKTLEPNLREFKNIIKNISYDYSEKSWIYVTITLK